MNEKQKLHFKEMLVWLALSILSSLAFFLPSMPFLFVKFFAFVTFLISYVMFWVNGYFYFKNKTKNN